jgi:hypothetical protein
VVKGTAVIAEAVNVNKTLTSLVLTNNDVRAMGAGKIAEALQ